MVAVIELKIVPMSSSEIPFFWSTPGKNGEGIGYEQKTRNLNIQLL
jgi:hypothetical protein